MMDRHRFTLEERLAIVETQLGDVKAWIKSWDARLWMILLSTLFSSLAATGALVMYVLGRR